MLSIQKRLGLRALREDGPPAKMRLSEALSGDHSQQSGWHEGTDPSILTTWLVLGALTPARAAKQFADHRPGPIDIG